MTGHRIEEKLSTHDVNVATILSQFTIPELIIPCIPWLLDLFSDVLFQDIFKTLACWLQEHSHIDYFHQQRTLQATLIAWSSVYVGSKN